MRDAKLNDQESDQLLEEAPRYVGESATRNPPLTETSGIWATLAAYFAPPDVRPSVQPEISAWREDDDFSAEHGYEPEFEGRSEFEHGEFDRWL